MSPRNRIFLLSFALLSSTAPQCFGMQLGAANGSAVFGRPLDLTIPVRLEATTTEDLANCFIAEVFQADTKFDAGRVRVDVTPSANGLDAVVRVRSATSVTEPWAKLILRSNCGSKVTRQYELLTDFVTDLPPAMTQAELLNLSNVPTLSAASSNQRAETSQSPQQTYAEAPSSKPLSTSSAAPTSNWTVKRAQAKPKVESKPEPKVVAKIDKKLAPTTNNTSVTQTAQATGLKTTSKLKMETFELTDERQVLLKLSSALIAPTGVRTPEEVQSLAQATAVWRAINGMAPELSAAKKAEPTVEANAAAMAALQAKLQAAQKKEYANPLVYGLLALLGLALACLAWMFMRSRRAKQNEYGWLDEKVDLKANEPLHEPLPYRVKGSHNEPSEPYLADTAEQTQFQQKSTAEIQLPKKTPVQSSVFEKPATSNFGGSSSATTKSNQVKDADVAAGQDASVYRPSSVLAGAAAVISSSDTVAATMSDSDIEAAQLAAKKVPVDIAGLHFDERLDDAKSSVKRPAHDKPITSTTALMDMVLADSPAKLRSVPTPIPDVDIALGNDTKLNDASAAAIDFEIQAMSKPTGKPETSPSATPTSDAAGKKPAPASDTKSNMIDFDIFAEPPAVLQKPTRFNR
jgi:hypothetical protein